MTGLRGEQRRSANRSRKRRRLAAIIVSATVVALIAAGAIIWLPWRSSEATSPTAANPAVSPAPLKPTPTPTPLTPAQALLAGTEDPNACAVSFAGEGIADAPILQTVDTLYTGLPVPTRDGAVFAGWYASDADAAALTTAQRLNGSKLVACTDQQTTLHAGWTTPEANVAEAAFMMPKLFIFSVVVATWLPRSSPSADSADHFNGAPGPCDASTWLAAPPVT